MSGVWVRSAFWVGRPRNGEAERFEALLNDELVPAMRLFPGVASVEALWPQAREAEPPDIYCQVIVRFDSAEDMVMMLASDERTALRPRVVEAVALFDGTLSHIDYNVL